MREKIPLIILSLLLTCVTVNAAITGTNGTVSNGESVTISGSSFGTKSPAAPILWDQFEYGSNGNQLQTFDNWDAYGGAGASNGGLISTDDSYSGTRSAYNSVTGADASCDFCTSNFFFNASDKVFYSYKLKWTSSNVTGGITKFGRINASPNSYNGDGNFAYSSGGAVTGGGAYFFNEPGGGSGYGFQQYVTAGPNVWHKIDMYSELSTPAGTANGVNWFSVDSTDYNRTGEVNRASGETFQQDNIILGIMFANITGSSAIVETWVDDVYVDNTSARVELCSGSAWTSRGTCDIQIPTSWSSTSITATVNQGSFAADATAYLYVVDADGAVNSTGYEVTIGAGGSSGPKPSAIYSAGGAPVRQAAGGVPVK